MLLMIFIIYFVGINRYGMREKTMIVPVGGLANRMRSVASAVALARETGQRIEVMWFTDWALRAPFGQLFTPPDESLCTVTDASMTDLLLFDRPRRKNLFLPRIAQKLLFRSCLYEEQMSQLMRSGYDFRRWMSQGGGYMATCYNFYPYPKGLVATLFRPNAETARLIAQRTAAFRGYTIGVHVRRTDHTFATQASPIELFFEIIDRERIQHPDLTVYLATDSEEVKLQMRQRYGNMIISASNRASRDSVSGIREGITDMYALAHTQRIYGSYGSSFSEIAAEIGGIPFEAVRCPLP